MMDRFKRLSVLLQTYNPFGVVENGNYVSYHTTKDAYVDIMMRITTLAPRGYIDIPLVMAVFMDVPIIKGMEVCRKRGIGEIMIIDMNNPSTETVDKWMSLLKRLLCYTCVDFDKNVFYAAWPEYYNIRMKQGAVDQVNNNSTFEKYYDTDSEGSETTERDSE